MKKVIPTLLISMCLATAVFAGDIPGSTPEPPCTQNCPGINSAPPLIHESPSDTASNLERSIRELLSGILSLAH